MDDKDLKESMNENIEQEMTQNNGFILVDKDEEEHNNQVEFEKTEFDRTEYDMAEESQRAASGKDVNETITEEPIKDLHSSQKEIKKKKSFRGSALSYIAIALVCSLLGGFASYFVAPKLFAGVEPTSTKYDAQPITINTSDNISAVTTVAKKAMSSVVGITTVETQMVWPFNTQDVSGVGSGVIVDSNGYILTNSHVVADGNAKELKVLFENGEKVDGTVLWNDAALDLAIVKVNVNNLPVAELGDSDELEIGELAVAIGNPLGLEFERTVTSGIISGLNRSVTVENRVVIDNLIQTDASINPGNSGGPLLNGKGQVIGINTAKVSSGEGMGFAIPINEAKTIIQRVIETGSFKTVFMGIKGIASEEYQTRLGIELSTNKGIILVEVEAGSPAAIAGLQAGDIITKIDNVEVNDMSELKAELIKYKENDKAKIEIVRNTEIKVLEIEFTVFR